MREVTKIKSTGGPKKVGTNMKNLDKKNVNGLPIFGKDIIDDWSWDREEEELRESSESEYDE